MAPDVEPGRAAAPSPHDLPDRSPERGRFTRREVIKLAGITGLAGLLASGCSPAFPGIAQIGAAWMRIRPSEATVPALLALLPAGTDAAALPGANLRAAASQITADFVTGDIEWVEGWMLSATEGRIAALHALR